MFSALLKVSETIVSLYCSLFTPEQKVKIRSYPGIVESDDAIMQVQPSPWKRTQFVGVWFLLLRSHKNNMETQRKVGKRYHNPSSSLSFITCELHQKHILYLKAIHRSEWFSNSKYHAVYVWFCSISYNTHYAIAEGSQENVHRSILFVVKIHFKLR